MRGKHIFFAALCLLVIAGFASCKGATKTADPAKELAKLPAELNYDRLNVPELSLDSVTLEHHFVITNPAGVPVTASRVAYKYQFVGKLITETEEPLNLEVPANGKAEFAITQKIDFPKEYEKMKAVSDQKDGVFKAKGTVYTTSGELPLQIEGDIMLPKLPSIKLVNAGISRDAADQLSFGFEVNLMNENGFKVYAEYLDYELFVEGVSIKKDKILIGERVTSPGFGYNVNTYLMPDNLGKDVMKKVIEASLLNYELKGEIKLQNFTVPFDIVDTLKFSR